MPTVHIKYFASVREALGKSAEQLRTEATTVGGVRDALLARGGAYAQELARGKAIRIALNQTMSEESAALSEGCEIAFFPPVTGG
jgi:molybdopterin synthase sulfur carrier subunit